MAAVVVLVVAEGELVVTVQVRTLVTPPLLRAAFARAPEEAPAVGRQSAVTRHEA